MDSDMPDPFVLVVVLTFFVGILAVFMTDHTPTQVLGFWGDGFWNLLEFSMQMVLIVVTGHVMASSPFF